MKRTLSLLAAAASLFLLVAVPANANTFVGTWRGSTMVNGAMLYSSLVLEPTGHFNELDRMGTLMSEQTGTWSVVRGMLYLHVEDWAPKEQCLPTTGCVPIRMPPGSLYRVRWLSANVIRCQDVNLGGTITYRRA
jgi:hypothetical protein